MTDAPGTPRRLYFVRHGETDWCVSGRHTGRTDLPLNACGEMQASALAPWLGAVAFSRVLTSPSARARRTCELAGLGAAAETEPKLSEWDYGDYEGLTSADIRRRRPGWDVFRDGCPGGESPAQVGARADRLIEELSRAEGDVAMFSHGQFGCVLAARWIASAPTDGRRFSLDPASMSILDHKARGDGDIQGIALWNASPETLR